jgi:hypothetical protein
MTFAKAHIISSFYLSGHYMYKSLFEKNIFKQILRLFYPPIMYSLKTARFFWASVRLNGAVVESGRPLV